MRICAFVLLFCYVQCRKTYAPIDKNANVAFINMEGGGIRPAPSNVRPNPTPAPKTPEMPKPALQPAIPTTLTPIVPSTVKQTPAATVQPTNKPSQITPKPVYPTTPAAKPITTPGPGSVKQLITFYDSQGKASPIRPYTYSQAVKQG